MSQDLDSLRRQAEATIAAAASAAALETARVDLLGRKGSVTELMKGLGKLAAEERKAAGAALNVLKDQLAAAIEARGRALAEEELTRRLIAERVDVTLPPRPVQEGRIHPISQTIDEMVAIFGEMGFVVAEGPDIEEDFYNFTALNIPPEHPARQLHDTFYLAAPSSGGNAGAGGAAGVPAGNEDAPKVLRTHTSPVQIRTMLAQKPPIRIIVPGRAFRRDDDATHSPNFHQIEGLVVDRTTHMGHLKGCLIEFARAFFDIPDLPVRFRPSYFPFTEPSAEVDIGCSRAGGELKIGAGDDWLEILGCGMVHSKVLANCGIDPSEYQGFAFGMGIERAAMLKYGVPDLRNFFESDLRWLRHYGFLPVEVPSLTGGLTR